MPEPDTKTAVFDEAETKALAYAVFAAYQAGLCDTGIGEQWEASWEVVATLDKKVREAGYFLAKIHKGA